MAAFRDVQNDFVERARIAQIELRGAESIAGIFLITAGIRARSGADLGDAEGKNFRTQGGSFSGA